MDLPISGETRDEIARILEMVATEGLAHPRNLDAAIDAIGSAFQCQTVQKIVDDQGQTYWLDADQDANDAFGDDVIVTQGFFIPEVVS